MRTFSYLFTFYLCLYCIYWS